MAMTPLPPAPSRGDPVNFAVKGDALMAALPGFVDEANALQVDVAEKQQTASDAAATATTKATEAGNSAGAASDSASTAATKASEASSGASAALNSQNAAAMSETNAAQSAVQAANSAASVDPQSLASDYASPTPPAITWPYMKWADTANGVLSRRNAANDDWVIEGRLLRAHLPMYAQIDVPTLDIGPIYIIGKGPAEWKASAYDPLIKSIPAATFAEVAAAEADQGPVLVTDMAGELYTWQSSPYFNGYRSVRCGLIYGGPWDDPDLWEALLVGGVWSVDDPRLARLIAKFQEKGRTTPAANWAKGVGLISDIGNGDWKAPDYQNVFLRMSGTDVDTANAMTSGSYKSDTAQGHWHSTYANASDRQFNNVVASPGNWPQAGPNNVRNSGGEYVKEAISDGVHGSPRVGMETAPKHTRVTPIILV